MLFDDWHLITVELPKLNDDIKTLNALEKQLYVIKNAGSLSERPDEFHDKDFDKLFGVINFASMDEKDQEMYESEFRWILNRNSEMATAREDGREEGIKATATALKSKGIDVELIAECTGLTVEQIKQL